METGEPVFNEGIERCGERESQGCRLWGAKKKKRAKAGGSRVRRGGIDVSKKKGRSGRKSFVGWLLLRKGGVQGRLGGVIESAS